MYIGAFFSRLSKNTQGRFPSDPASERPECGGYPLICCKIASVPCFVISSSGGLRGLP